MSSFPPLEHNIQLILVNSHNKQVKHKIKRNNSSNRCGNLHNVKIFCPLFASAKSVHQTLSTALMGAVSMQPGSVMDTMIAVMTQMRWIVLAGVAITCHHQATKSNRLVIHNAMNRIAIVNGLLRGRSMPA